MTNRSQPSTSCSIPLTTEQVSAATRVRERLPGRRESDRPLRTLREHVPGFSPDESLLKVVALNGLYGTNVYSVVAMAHHVSRVMAEYRQLSSGPTTSSSARDRR